MFYAFLLLGKKGPLAKVWLAAHWEKKLTKANVFETDVESSVERIKAPPVKISLRTSGHLLLGLSRIYLRKAKYLFQDCSEVFTKIRMAFRPGTVDLPPQTREADPQVITLPDLFKNFEEAVAEINHVNLETDFTIPEARIKAITMPDDSHSMDHRDNFNDIGGFGEFDGEFDEVSSFELVRDQIDQVSLELSKDNPSIEAGKTKSSRNQSPDPNLHIEEVPNRPSLSLAGMDEFGPGLGETTLADLSSLANIPEDNVAEPSRQDETEDMDTSNVTIDALHGQRKRSADTAMTDFTLESINNVSTVGFKKPHPPGDDMPVNKKRRSTAAAVNRSTADTEVKLSTTEIRKWFEDQSDIETDIISAPANSFALLPRLSADQKPFEMATFDGDEDNLIHFYTLACTEAESRKEDVDSTVDQELDSASVSHAQDSIPGLADAATLQSEEDFTIDQELDTTSVSRAQDPIPAFTDPANLQDEEDMLVNGEEDTGPNEDERPDEYEDRKWNKKTQQVLNEVSSALGKKNKPVLFNEVLDNTSRKQAATNFFSLLLLTTRGSLTLKQSEPYGDILVSKGTSYVPSMC